MKNGSTGFIRMIELSVFAATLLLVFGRAIQQLNVTGGHYVAAAITPFFIAAGEIAVISAVAVEGWAMWPWIGAGGAVGSTTAMIAHAYAKNKLSRKRES